MSLGFILGTAAKDHDAVLLEEIKKIQATDKQAKIYYLVPNHIKFATEVSVLDNLRQAESGRELFAATELQVLSFSRLAWYFMKNEPLYQIPRLSAAGTNMLVHKILREKNDELTIFRSEQTRPGFISQLANQLVELSLGLVTSEDLTNSLEKLSQTNDRDLLAKLTDLSVVYREFEKMTAGKYLGNANLLENLAKYLAKTDLSHSYFILAGFSQFNAGEYQVIETLLTQAKQVTVSLILDHPVASNGELNTFFYRSSNVYLRLLELAKKHHQKVWLDRYAKQTRVSDDLVELEKYWIASNQLKQLPAPVQLAGDIKVICADDRLEEVRYLATKIRQMVLLEGYRYQDFLILTRHLEAYKNIIGPTFNQFEIPFFTDLQKKMADHPLVELITALFLVEQRNYRYEDIMRLLKTELLIPKENREFWSLEKFREALDLAENQVLKFGYRKKGWLAKDWTYYRFGTSDFGVRTENEDQITVKINSIRQYVKQILPPFYQKMQQAKTGQEAASVLLNFLLENGVLARLDLWRKQALDAGEVDASTREEQVWGVFCELLDEYVEILGETPFVADDFLALLQAGFEGANYSQVPTTLDQVVVSETGMVQPTDKKVVMLLGSTDLVMPDATLSADLLSDRDKAMLTPTLREGSYLSEDTEHVLANEPFLNYLAFMAPTEKLYLSYPLGGNDDAQFKCSPYVERIQQHFALPVYRAQKNDGTKPALDYIGSKRTTLSELIKVERQARNEQEDLPTEWQFIFQKFAHDPEIKELFERLNQSLDYKNIPEQLSAKSVAGLYGKKLSTSISRLEDFYANPYEYFLRYGLGLKEREIFEMNAADTGEYFHTLMDTFFKLLLREGRDLKQLTSKEFDDYFQQTIALTSGLPQFEILDSSNRMRFLARQLNGAAKQVGRAIKKQRQFSPVKTIKTEALFGQVGKDEGFSPLEFVTPKKRLVTVRGKIDRIDELVVKNKHYLNLVDYKSGAKSFDYAKAYFGLALQLLTYLDALLHNKDKLVPNATAAEIEAAGAMYMHLYNPTLKQKDIYKNDYESELLKKNRYSGLLLNKNDVLENLDEQVEEKSGPSLIYPFRKNKSGEYKGTQQLVSAEQLSDLVLHNEELIKQATDMIFDGRIDLTPALFKDGSALDYTPYEAIMQFDAMLPENNYYRLPTENVKDILALLAKEREERNG